MYGVLLEEEATHDPYKSQSFLPEPPPHPVSVDVLVSQFMRKVKTPKDNLLTLPPPNLPSFLKQDTAFPPVAMD